MSKKYEKFNLLNPEHSYFFGFAQADGHLMSYTRNRGRLSIEISTKDLEILEKFQNIIPYKSYISTRIRDTNFKKKYSSSRLNFYSFEFRETINKLGLLYGKKSKITKPPKDEHIKKDYIRGIIDGDGSVGYDKNGRPFIGICTSSFDLMSYILDFEKSITNIERKINRNKRDDVYNLVIWNESALEISKIIYYDNCLCLKRKGDKASSFMTWTRKNSKAPPRKRWTDYEDLYILNHSIEESCKTLKRTNKSITIRLWRLKNDKV